MRLTLRLTRGLLASSVLVTGLVSCTGSDGAEPRPAPTTTPTVPAALEVDEPRPVRDPRQALAFVPESAETVTITDFDMVRARFGVPDLTSDDLMTDRTAFWERYDRESVALTDGLLRERHSTYWLDHGFTQDDVDWEARWTGPDGPGYVVAFRPDLEMERVRGALEEKELRGAELLAPQRLLVKGAADEGEVVWATDADLVGLTDTEAESTYLHKGCVPLQAALGPGATYEDQAAVLARHDVEDLLPLEAFSIGFDDQTATARIGAGRLDALERQALLDGWPVTGSIGLDDAFDGMPVADPGTGRIGLRVANPRAAALVTMTEMLPFAVCDEVVPFEEPTGL
jgi:hypothetical protein